MKLLDLQRRMAADLMAPLTGADDRLQGKIKAEYIRPNDRLTARERLQIYSRSYWCRVIDAMYEDFPGLRAVAGQRAFDKLVRAYLADCPSQSFTLRDLGSRLEPWLRKNPRFAGKKFDLSIDMIRLEWAHIEAWDGAEEKILGPEDLLELGPGLRVGVQPYIRLLALNYPVDDLRIRVNTGEHETASNAVTKPKARRAISGRSLQPKPIRLAVHRVDFSIYYRRLSPDEFRLLELLREGRTVGKALMACCKTSTIPVDELQPMIEAWFSNWSELGWLCHPPKKARS